MITRRQTLAATAALPLAAVLPATAARAEAPIMGASFAQHRRFALGDFEVTTILAGTAPRDNPQGIFGLNVTPEEFAEVSTRNFLSADMTQFYFTLTVVNTGQEVILFDTGLNGAGITDALARAGYTPDQIDTVVLTHMHGDHIGGLFTDGSPTFANASYVAGQVEFDHLAAAGNGAFEANVRPLAERMRFIGDGDEVIGGITGLAAFGHTPGHMVFRMESAGAELMLFADLANHPVWSLAHPDWEVRFDIDKAAAASARREVLAMIAAERIPAIGYHMPFPALGYVDTRGDGFHWVAEAGQLMG